MLGRVLAVLVLLGCEGPAGAAGADGVDGEDGERGPQGERGPAGDAGLPGEPGSQGDPGPQGERGEDGADGASGLEVVESVLCQKIQGGWAFSYQAVIFSDGSVLVTCSVADGNRETSATVYYDEGQNGATAQACNVQRDAENDGQAGWWEFELDGNDYLATYHDDGSGFDGDTVEFDGSSATDDGCSSYTD